ncbi:DUF6600 domain-containing protein [Prosthecobacter sp.]|jgi:hypothetical protein|uniref:DUF6600 domain-containing protein n=1 Tax=Prosthecobacter sp. TaxID=1965333 RepID=UPI0037C7C366
MKRSLILLFAVLIAAVAPLAPARAQSGGDALPIEFVYDALGPYGDWIYTPNYGYVWQPLASQQPGWSPYADGSWAFTDAGWTWISNEDFGWLTYHYGRWIRLMGNWMWVPGNEWAPAWVSWRQTQGQIGWAPLPPEAMWSPNVGFGGWTDSYYDVGPAYYNFVPVGLFASSGSILSYILDRSRNFTYYDQSVNVTHTVFQQNVMNHIFVGGPDPQRINGMGGNQVRRLTLRHDEEGFRRNWMDRPGGGPPRGEGGRSRIERGQLLVAAPSFRRDASQGLPSRVRESLEKPVTDRGWQGGADTQRLRQKQRDDLERTRPAILPEKRVLPATSTAPPPATGRVLNAEERRGRGGNAPGTMPPNADNRPKKDDERQPMTPKNPLPPGGPPGVPPRTPTVPGAGTVPPAGRPRSNDRPDKDLPPGQRPGMKPGQPQDERPVIPPGKPQDDTPKQRPGMKPGVPQGDRPVIPPGKPQDDSPKQRPGMKPDETPGRRPGERNSPAPDGARPGIPKMPQVPQTPQVPKRREPQAPPPVVVPTPGQPPGAGRQPGFPGRRPGQPGNAPPQQQRPQQPPSVPVAPPRVMPVPVPQRPPQAPPQQRVPQAPPQQRPQQPPPQQRPQQPTPQQPPPVRVQPPQQPPAAPGVPNAPQEPGGRRRR